MAAPARRWSVDLPLPAGKSVTQTNYADLTAHPYAGLMVDAHLEARDAAGQIGKSRTITFRLPARVFTDPLARALIEQRQNLATSDAAGRKLVATALDAFAIAPDHFYADKPGLYMGLRAAYWGTRERPIGGGYHPCRGPAVADGGQPGAERAAGCRRRTAPPAAGHNPGPGAACAAGCDRPAAEQIQPGDAEL